MSHPGQSALKVTSLRISDRPMSYTSLLALTLLLTITPTTHAAGGDHRIDQLGRSTGWKPGYYEVIKQPNLVHGYWINTSDVFFFKGFNEDLIKQLNELERIEGFKTEVIIHAKLRRQITLERRPHRQLCRLVPDHLRRLQQRSKKRPHHRHLPRRRPPTRRPQNPQILHRQIRRRHRRIHPVTQ